MSFLRRGRRHPRPLIAIVGLAAFSLALAGTLLGVGPGGGGSRAAAQAPGEPTPRTDDSVPASNVTMIGSSPNEAPNETWGVGQGEEGNAVLVRYAAGSGWSLGPGLLDADGQPL
ncbi:MAG TPA: hypothetical protein VN889_03980, partial [Solirubrobacteraceae bacterium]|nr:hypothetical protein [Solirubrobacteraceae bacterium]